MLFVVYQQIELDTFLPIALEFKRLKKRKDVLSKLIGLFKKKKEERMKG